MLQLYKMIKQHTYELGCVLENITLTEKHTLEIT
jgi:hypothetical protein